jgi:hypothetical protein
MRSPLCLRRINKDLDSNNDFVCRRLINNIGIASLQPLFLSTQARTLNKETGNVFLRQLGRNTRYQM